MASISDKTIKRCKTEKERIMSQHYLWCQMPWWMMWSVQSVMPICSLWTHYFSWLSWTCFLHQKMQKKSLNRRSWMIWWQAPVDISQDNLLQEYKEWNSHFTEYSRRVGILQSLCLHHWWDWDKGQGLFHRSASICRCPWCSPCKFRYHFATSEGRSTIKMSAYFWQSMRQKSCQHYCNEVILTGIGLMSLRAWVRRWKNPSSYNNSQKCEVRGRTKRASLSAFRYETENKGGIAAVIMVTPRVNGNTLACL